jgi:tetratricopeptide (TPR) repeat protein
MKNFKLFVLFLFVTAFCSEGIKAQNVDSLKLELKNTQNDTSRCSLLALLSETAPDEEWPAFNKELLVLTRTQLNRNPQHTLLRKRYLHYYAIAVNNEGILLKLRGDIAGALKLFNESLKIREGNDDPEGQAECLNNIADVYDVQGDPQKALVYFQKCLAIFEKTGNKEGIAYSLNNMGLVYKNTGDHSEAMRCYDKSLELRKQAGDKEGIATSLNNIGGIYFVRRDFNNALEIFKSCLEKYEEIEDYEGKASTLNNISSVYRELGNSKLALEFSLKSLECAKQAGFPEDIRNAAEMLNGLYKASGNYSSALEYYELYIAMRDSITNTETRKASIKSQLKYEYEKKSAADSVKNAEEQKVKDAQLSAQTASLKQERTQRYALYGGLVLIAGFLAFVFNRFRVTNRQKKIIEQQKVVVDRAYHTLEEKNKEVMDSIYYARRIQRALITSEKYIERNLGELKRK